MRKGDEAASQSRVIGGSPRFSDRMLGAYQDASPDGQALFRWLVTIIAVLLASQVLMYTYVTVGGLRDAASGRAENRALIEQRVGEIHAEERDFREDLRRWESLVVNDLTMLRESARDAGQDIDPLLSPMRPPHPMPPENGQKAPP